MNPNLLSLNQEQRFNKFRTGTTRRPHRCCEETTGRPFPGTTSPPLPPFSWSISSDPVVPWSLTDIWDSFSWDLGLSIESHVFFCARAVSVLVDLIVFYTHLDDVWFIFRSDFSSDSLLVGSKFWKKNTLRSGSNSGLHVKTKNWVVFVCLLWPPSLGFLTLLAATGSWPLSVVTQSGRSMIGFIHKTLIFLCNLVEESEIRKKKLKILIKKEMKIKSYGFGLHFWVLIQPFHKSFNRLTSLN